MTNLQRIREEKKFTRGELARRSGVSFRMIQYYEQGAKDINKAQVTTVLKLADALEVTIPEILNK